MDPVTLIVAALAAGASAGVTDTAQTAIKDSYNFLKKLVLRRVSDDPAGTVAIEQHAEDPETWQAPVQKALAKSGAAEDQEIIAAAQRLLAQQDPAGTEAGRYVITITASGQGAVAAHTITGGVSTASINRADP